MFKWYKRYKERREDSKKVAEFTTSFFRIFSVVKRYERGLGRGLGEDNDFSKFGLCQIREEGETIDTYSIKWAIKEIDRLRADVGIFNSAIGYVFLASFDKIMSELKERAEKFNQQI